MKKLYPIHKATIIPRGRALGMVMNLPERDKHGYSNKYLKARLAVCFGGRVAEEIIFGKDDNGNNRRSWFRY